MLPYLLHLFYFTTYFRLLPKLNKRFLLLLSQNFNISVTSVVYQSLLFYNTNCKVVQAREWIDKVLNVSFPLFITSIFKRLSNNIQSWIRVFLFIYRRILMIFQSRVLYVRVNCCCITRFATHLSHVSELINFIKRLLFQFSFTIFNFHTFYVCF